MSRRSKNIHADVDPLEELDTKDIFDDELNSGVPLTAELDDAYASEYFRKFEPDPNYASNATMPDDDGSQKTTHALRQHCKERGLKYIRHNGSEQPARQVKEACSCRKLCYMKFLDDVRKKLLANLLKLSTNGQFIFLSSHIKCVAVQRPRFKYFPRKSVRLYYLPSNSGQIQVCMRMFANTYDITDKKLRLLNEKMHIESYGEVVNKFTTQNSSDDLVSQTSASKCNVKPEKDEDVEPNDSNASVDFIEIPLMRDLGNMEEYFMQYETDAGFQFRMEDLIFNSELRKQTAKKLLAERQYRKAKGYAYIRLDGTEAPERKLKPECSCKLMCSLKISNDARQILLNNLLNLSHEGQENFIYRHMQLKKTTFQRHIIRHFLPTISGLVKVCKSMFLNTFDITNKRVRVILSKKRRENQKIEDDNTELDRMMEATSENDYCEDEADCEVEDEIEIEHSSSFVKVESEDDSIESNIAVDEELALATIETIESPEELDSTFVSSLEPEIALDDTFLDQYFHRYETNFGQEEPTNKKAILRNKNLRACDNPSFQPCSCVTYGCALWFTKDLQKMMFSRYTKLSPLNKKRFLYRLISKENKRRNKKHQSRRNFSMYYYLPTIKGYIKVCKVMFMNTFKITDRNLRSIVGNEKFEEPRTEEVTMEEDSTFTQEELVGVNEANDVSCHEDEQHADEITDNGKGCIQSSSLLVNTPVSPHIKEKKDEAVKIETNEVMETSCSNKVFKQEFGDAINENNSIAIDEELDISALTEPEENDGQSDYQLDTIPQLEEENDDVFLDQYFYRYETNFGQAEPPKTQNKSTKKWWSFYDANETPSEPCSCVTYNCSSWFSNDLRQKLFTRYARLSLLNKKRFLYRHIRREHKRRSYTCNSRRNFSMFYFVPTSKGYVKVCKVMFMNTFKVSDKKLRAIVCNEQFSDPSEVTANEDPTCIKLDPDDFLIDIDENFLEEGSNNMSCNEADDIGHSLNEQDPESCSTNQYSIETEDSTESCEEDDKMPSNDLENEANGSGTDFQQQQVVELDDDFLDEYFNRYDTNKEQSELAIGRPRKIWIKHDDFCTIQPPCSCLRKCYAIYSDDARRAILTRFAKLSTLNQKRFLFRHIRQGNPYRRKFPKSRRQNNWSYYLPDKSGPVKICRVMFLNTFGVTEKKLRNLVRRKQFVEQESDVQNAQLMSSNVTCDNACDDSNKREKRHAEVKDNTSNKIAEQSVDEYSEYENYFAEVAESAVEPLLSILGCSTVTRHNDSPDVAELDEKFLDKYFHDFRINDAGQTIRTKLGKHGNTFTASKILSPIACACNRMCHITFPDKIRQAILDRYAKLSIGSQINFLANHVKKKTLLNSMDKQFVQESTCLYYLPSKSGLVRVCNIMFLNTFNVNEHELHEFILYEAGPSQKDANVENEYQKTKIKTEPDLHIEIKIENNSGSESSTKDIVGDNAQDQRADHSNSPPQKLFIDDLTCDKLARENNMCMPGTSKQPQKVSNIAIRFAKEHICSFPRITSHFCEAVNKTKYISCFLDVTRMYIAYINSCTESSGEPVSSKIYSAILQKERAKDPVLPSICDVCQHKEGIDPDEDKFWYEDLDA